MTDYRQIAWPAYLVSIAMITIPFFDAGISLYPWNPTDARWRFGAVGMFSNAMLIPTTGVLVAFVTSVLANHHNVRRAIGIVSLVVAILCLGALVVFVLDALQTRASVNPEILISFNVASVTAAVKTLLAAITLLGFALASRQKSSRRGGGEEALAFTMPPAGRVSKSGST
jgi:hypothetical protein